MRKLVTTAAAVLALSAMAYSAPALADHNDNAGNGYGANGYNQNQPYQGYNGNNYQGQNYGTRDRDFNDRGFDKRGFDHRNFDFNRHEGRFRAWERGWRNDFGFRHVGYQLSYWQLIRRIERQGYFGVRGLRPSGFGFGWRAFAFYRSDGHPVMLRVDPHTGRVLAARHL